MFNATDNTLSTTTVYFFIAVLLILSYSQSIRADTGETTIRNKMNQLLYAYKEMISIEPDCPINTKGFNEGLNSTINEYRKQTTEADKQQFVKTFEERMNNTINDFKTMSAEDISRECDKERSRMASHAESTQETGKTVTNKTIKSTSSLTETELQQQINKSAMDSFYRSEQQLITLFNKEINSTNDMNIMCMGYSPEDSRNRINSVSPELLDVAVNEEKYRMRSIEDKIHSLTNEQRKNIQSGCRLMFVRLAEQKQKIQEDEGKVDKCISLSAQIRKLESSNKSHSSSISNIKYKIDEHIGKAEEKVEHLEILEERVRSCSSQSKCDDAKLNHNWRYEQYQKINEKIYSLQSSYKKHAKAYNNQLESIKSKYTHLNDYCNNLAVDASSVLVACERHSSNAFCDYYRDNHSPMPQKNILKDL